MRLDFAVEDFVVEDDGRLSSMLRWMSFWT